MPQKHGGKSLANKKPKTAPKMQPQRAAGSKGGGRNAFLNAEELEVLREFAAERRQSADEAKKKETARSVVKQLRKEGYELVKKGSSGTAAPDSSFDDQELDEESSTDDEEKMELKRMIKKERRRAEQAATELTALKAEGMASFDGDADTPDADRKMTREQWLQAERKAKERSKPKPRGLFDAFFPPDDASETSESSPLVEMLREKLQLADDRMEISKGVSVSKEAEALIVKKAKEVATKQFNASHTPSLIALKEEFFPHSQAKRNDTILTALIRACTSRRVTISNVDFGLE